MRLIHKLTIATALILPNWSDRVEHYEAFTQCPTIVQHKTSALPHFKAFAANPNNARLRIAAVGSSSTLGVGAPKGQSYPAFLQRILNERFPRSHISVDNHGIGWEDLSDILKRLPDILKQKPDIVFLQIGSNKLMQKTGLDGYAAEMREAISMVRLSGANLVVVNPQSSDRINAEPEKDALLTLMSTVARLENVPLFDRYGMMEQWKKDKAFAARAVTNDNIHLSAEAYYCWAKAMEAVYLPPRPVPKSPTVLTKATSPVPGLR